MKITILGSGTSTGVPQIGCTCEVCRSADPRDSRLRTSALVETDDARILIDCGPDFREQMLHVPFGRLDGILLTHEHYDHTAGIDDVRPFCAFGDIDIYLDSYTAGHLRERLPYFFRDHLYPGVPTIHLKEVEPLQPFFIQQTQVLPLQVLHGALPILGYRIGQLGYVTDMKTMPEPSVEALTGVELLLVNALRFQPHPTHQTVADAMALARRVGAKETYFIHASHHIGLHAELEKQLPPHFHMAYDFQTLLV